MASLKFLLPKPANRETNCGNTITEIEKKKFMAIVAMPLPKMGGKIKQWLPKSGKELKKKSVTFTIFLQHFHNKLQVISYYQFKFEFNTKITFLIQQ